MPTILRNGAYRFFFYTNEPDEPPHIHIQHTNKLAKFWLHPVSLASSIRFRPHEIRELERIIKHNVDILIEAWNEHFHR